MSKWLELDADGNYHESLAFPDECKHKINEVCCEAQSELVADFPSEEDCERCPFYEEED